jgi:hypothetical protein
MQRSRPPILAETSQLTNLTVPVAKLLKQAGYSLQANSKTLEGAQHPDRDAQFGYLNTHVERFQADGDPVISVDTKKKELVGNYKAAGRE